MTSTTNPRIVTAVEALAQFEASLADVEAAQRRLRIARERHRGALKILRAVAANPAGHEPAVAP